MTRCIDLTNLIDYMNINPGRGHTVSLFTGAANVTSPTIVIVHSAEFGRQLGKQYPNPSIRYITLDEVERNGLKGLQLPVLIDNMVWVTWLTRYHERVVRLKQHNEKLAGKIKSALRHLEIEDEAEQC